MEEWKPVRQAPEYSVSNLGRLKSEYTNRPLVGGVDKNGYRRVVMCTNGRRVYARVATLVCEAFHGPRPRGAVVRHLDGSRMNDSASNLAWGSQRQNIADKKKHGTICQGEKHPRAKLRRADVLAIRRTDEPVAVLAEMYGVSKATISAIRTRRTWKHIAP